MIITEKDVGKKVKLRNGMTDTILKLENTTHSGDYYLVKLKDTAVYLTIKGTYWSDGSNHEFDILYFVDEEDTTEEQEFEDNGQFIQKVPSAESNAKRFLSMLVAQGIHELTVVTDIGELRCKLNIEKKGEV